MAQGKGATSFAVLRIVTGLLVFPHGVRKVIAGPIDAIGGAVTSQGFPAWMAWLVTAGELCGLLLALGLFTRLAGLAVGLTMGSIVVFVQADKLAQIGTGAGASAEYPLLLAVIGLLFVFYGPTPWSVDARRRR
jgi:uncharacterized membrane protein YphA (DoxX/SURF4 family)